MLAAIKSLSDGRFEDYLTYLHDDVQFYTIGSTPYSGLIVGRAEVWKKVLSKTTSSIGPGGYHEKILTVISEGEHVAVRSVGTETMTSGFEYNNEYAAFYRVVNGLIIEISFYLDTDLLIRSKK